MAQPEGKDTILCMREIYDGDNFIFNPKDITSEYLCYIPSIKAAVLRINTVQLNQIYP